MRVYLLLFMLMLILAPGCAPALDARDRLPPPRAAGGSMELRDWDFAAHGNVTLDGEWEFYWQKLYYNLEEGAAAIESFEWMTELTPKVQSRLDSHIFCRDKQGNESVLNIEPQGYKDETLPARMLRYCADIWEYTLSKKRGTPLIKQCVLLFYPEHDNLRHALTNRWSEQGNLNYQYRVIKVWEMDKEPIIENRLVGLYPLIPLMRLTERETAEQVIEQTVKEIETIENEALKSDIYAAFSILSGGKHGDKLINKYVRREMLMESPLFQHWVKEEREEAAMHAAIANTRQKTIAILAERFDFIPKSFREQLDTITDADVLDRLHIKSIKVATLDEYAELLNKAQQQQ